MTRDRAGIGCAGELRCAVCGERLRGDNQSGSCSTNNDGPHRLHRGLSEKPHLSGVQRRAACAKAFGRENAKLAAGRCQVREHGPSGWSLEVWTGSDFVVLAVWPDQRSAEAGRAIVHTALREAILTDREMGRNRGPGHRGLVTGTLEYQI